MGRDKITKNSSQAVVVTPREISGHLLLAFSCQQATVYITPVSSAQHNDLLCVVFSFEVVRKH
jgi:hypothetical protein